MTGSRLATVLAVGAVLIAACRTGPGGEQPCTAIGCTSGFYVDVAADLQDAVAYDVRACVDGACTSFTVGEPSISRAAGIEGVEVDTVNDRVNIMLEGQGWAGEHDLSLRISDGDADVVTIDRRVTMEPQYSNGERCGATCHTARVDE